MRVRYIGVFDAVFVLALGRSVSRGEAVEVSDALGAGLLAQGAPTDAQGAAAGAGTEWEQAESPARGKGDAAE
jgi:hypothetical protein